MDNRHMKKCSTLPIVTEMQIKTTELSPHSDQKWPSLISLKISKDWRGWGEKGTLLHCWWKCKLIQHSAKQHGGSSKLKIELPYDPAIPLLGIYIDKTIIQKDTCTFMFLAALFTTAKTWKQPKCPSTYEWIKMWYIYTMEYYSAM